MTLLELDSPEKSEVHLTEQPLRLKIEYNTEIGYNIAKTFNFNMKLAYTEIYSSRLLKIRKNQTRRLNLFRPPASSLQLNVL